MKDTRPYKDLGKWRHIFNTLNSSRWYYIIWGTGMGISIILLLTGIYQGQLNDVFRAGGFL
jgi:hypothetical protein